MKTSIVILTYNKLDYTKQCIESIRSYTPQGTYELIVVDNHSTDGTVDWLKKQEDIKTILNDINVGFPKGCNQGMEIAIGDNVLLLNNDVIVTENWLDNLVNALYSDSAIGAVGPVTNSAAYYTTIPASYQSLSEMHQFARNFNLSDPLKWDERLKLIGFCMLIKKQAIAEIGLLDEQFTPGNYEDDDYSVRLRKAGYKLLLCKDTFIHHYGSVSWKDNVNGYSTLLSENEKKFMNKWGTNSQSYIIHKELIDGLSYASDQEFDVLHIGCCSGGTLLEIRNRYKRANLFGVEKNVSEGMEAQLFSNVVIGGVEESFETVSENRLFDVIIITDWEHISNPSGFLKTINAKLKETGTLLTNFININNYYLAINILNGRNPLEDKHHYFSKEQIERFLSENGFVAQIENMESRITKEVEQAINVLCSISSNEMSETFKTYLYQVKAKKRNQELVSHIKNLNENQDAVIMDLLENYEKEMVVDYILHYADDPVTLLQAIGIHYYSKNMFEIVLHYFSKAVEIDPTNTDTLYNISFILKEYGEIELAKKYARMIKSDDDEIKTLKIQLGL